jgi:hypothetical protein
MAYRIEPVGKEFSGKNISKLQDQLTKYESEGWEFVFAFPVVQRTCIFLREETYLMVFRRRDS